MPGPPKPVALLAAAGLVCGIVACGDPGSRPEPSVTAVTSPSNPAPSEIRRPRPQPRSLVLAAVGDISPPRVGSQQQTADLALSWNPALTLVLGDLQYPDGTLAQFNAYYEPTWGRLKAKTRPVPGNHEYREPDARGYFRYFGTAASPQGRSYYSFDLNGWHIVALNSEIDNDRGSAQLDWLRADLAANTSRCILAYWHRPRFNSGRSHGSDESMAPFWNALYAERADVVLNGHEHNYQRFARQTPSGRADSGGIRQFVVGTGGAGKSSFGEPLPASEKRLDQHYGVLKLTVDPAGYRWQFISVDGAVRDSGANDCH